MAAVNTGTANASQLLRTAFQKMLEARLEKDLIFADLVDKRELPANVGNVLAFHRIQNLQIAPRGLSGGDAAGQGFGSPHPSIHATAGQLRGLTYIVDEVTATLDIFGADLEITEQMMMTSEPNPVPELMDIFTYTAAATLDKKIGFGVAQLNNTASDSAVPSADYNDSTRSVSVVWGDGTATLTEPTLDASNPTHRIAAESFNRAYSILRRESAPFHPRAGGGYVSVIGPGAAADLRMDGTFQEIALKGFKMGESKFEQASIGKVFGCLVLESPHVAGDSGTVNAATDWIFRNACWGRGYYVSINHAKGGGRPRVTFIPPTPSAGDVYGNIAFLVWKMYWAGRVVNPQCGVILKNVGTVGQDIAGYDRYINNLA